MCRRKKIQSATAKGGSETTEGRSTAWEGKIAMISKGGAGSTEISKDAELTYHTTAGCQSAHITNDIIQVPPLQPRQTNQLRSLQLSTRVTQWIG